MKNYPSKIKVGLSTYHVVIIPNLGGDGTNGFCDTDNKIIALNKGQKTSAMFSTFIHELLHSIETEHRIKLKHKKVYALEAALAQVLMDNFNISAKRR